MNPHDSSGEHLDYTWVYCHLRLLASNQKSQFEWPAFTDSPSTSHSSGHAVEKCVSSHLQQTLCNKGQQEKFRLPQPLEPEAMEASADGASPAATEFGDVHGLVDSVARA